MMGHQHFKYLRITQYTYSVSLSGLVSVVSQAFFAVGVALLSLLAYAIQDDWRMFTQAVTFLGLPFVFQMHKLW